MKLSNIICANGIFCVIVFMFLIVWVGVFFGETYPEIIIKETYLPTQCRVIASKVVSYKCCTKSCSYCKSCTLGEPNCEAFANSPAIENVTQSCCDGYHCCGTCCQTCHSTVKGRPISYSCNCYCCQSVASLSCSLTCRECWKPTVVMEYLSVKNETLISSMNKDCSYDYNCVNEYLNSWGINSTVTCFYNPVNNWQFVLSNEYTPYKFGIMYTFVGLTLSSFIIWVSFVLWKLLRRLGIKDEDDTRTHPVSELELKKTSEIIRNDSETLKSTPVVSLSNEASSEACEKPSPPKESDKTTVTIIPSEEAK